MARAGRGSSGGGSRSGGSRSTSRSSGGHRPSASRSSFGSSRAGRGSSSFSSGPRGGFAGPRPPRYPRHPGPRHPRYPRHYGGGIGLTNILASMIIFLIVAAILISCLQGFVRESQVSTIERQKLTSGNGYYTDCITDELGWFENEARTEARLKNFYEETGVQPMIVFKAYEANVSTDKAKETWAENYYETNIDREDAFLFVYFAEPNENDVGYMCYVNGYETSSVMDSEAVGIFWNYIDRYWYQDISTDDVMVKAFNDTANVIMRVSTTSKDVVKWAFVAVAVIGGGFIIIKIMKTKRSNDAQKAAETERILNTPLEKMETEADALADRYNSGATSNTTNNTNA